MNDGMNLTYKVPFKSKTWNRVDRLVDTLYWPNDTTLVTYLTIVEETLQENTSESL